MLQLTERSGSVLWTREGISWLQNFSLICQDLSPISAAAIVQAPPTQVNKAPIHMHRVDHPSRSLPSFLLAGSLAHYFALPGWPAGTLSRSLVTAKQGPYLFGCPALSAPRKRMEEVSLSEVFASTGCGGSSSRGSYGRRLHARPIQWPLIPSGVGENFRTFSFGFCQMNVCPSLSLCVFVFAGRDICSRHRANINLSTQ